MTKINYLGMKRLTSVSYILYSAAYMYYVKHSLKLRISCRRLTLLMINNIFFACMCLIVYHASVNTDLM